jgi:predicted HTH domain antitoxin
MTAGLPPTDTTPLLEVTFTLPVINIPAAIQVEALAKAKEAYVMALLSAGEISSGKAGSLLNIPRLEMIERMGQWGIPLFDDALELEDLEREVAQVNGLLDSRAE